MGELFVGLTHAVEGAPSIALSAALAWGVLSILLSPCHLASIPLVVGFVNGQGRIATRRAFVLSLAFSVGILVTIAVIGVITAAAGRIAGDLGRFGNYAVAAVFFVVGLVLLDIIRIPWSGPGRVNSIGSGAPAAFLLGLIFGVALGPCTFAYMAPMLAVALGAASEQPVYGALLLLFYGIGHCSVIVLAGTFTEIVQRYMNWNERSRGATILRRTCGALVILGGVYLIWTTI